MHVWLTSSWRTAGPVSSLRLTRPNLSSTTSVPSQSAATHRPTTLTTICIDSFKWNKCLHLPLCVCWLEAQESSHPQLLTVFSEPDLPPEKHTHIFIIVYQRCYMSGVQYTCNCVLHLDHRNVLLRGCRLNPVGHFDHGFDQTCHVLVHFVVGSVQVGSGRWADLLRLQLDQPKELKSLYSVHKNNTFWL